MWKWNFAFIESDLEIMSSSINPKSEQSLQDVVQILSLVASDTFELFHMYSILPTDCPDTRNKLTVAARQTKTQCDKLLCDAPVTLQSEIRQSLLAISENLENFAQLFETFSKNASLPHELFIDLRAHFGNVKHLYYYVCTKICISTLSR